MLKHVFEITRKDLWLFSLSSTPQYWHLLEPWWPFSPQSLSSVLTIFPSWNVWWLPVMKWSNHFLLHGMKHLSMSYLLIACTPLLFLLYLLEGALANDFKIISTNSHETWVSCSMAFIKMHLNFDVKILIRTLCFCDLLKNWGSGLVTELVTG